MVNTPEKETGMTNFDTYVVLVPNDPEGAQDGSFHPVQVLALDKQDAIPKAIEKWFGHAMTPGTYIVAKLDDLTAYEVEEERVPSIRNQKSLPDFPSTPLEAALRSS